MNVPADLLWPDAPVFMPASARLRHVLASWADEKLPPQPLHVEDDRLYVELSELQPCYPLCIELEGAVGSLQVGIDGAALYPQYSAELVHAACETEAARIELVEWILMPWLDQLESMLGSAVRVCAVTLGCVMPAESVALRLRAERGGHMQLAIAGDAMPWLSRALRRTRLTPWSWMRVPLTWLLRVEALSVRDVRALEPGALLLLDRERPYFYLGPRQRRRLMTAEWNNETDGAIVHGQASDTSQDRGQVLDLQELSFDIDVILATSSLSLEEASALCPGAMLELDRPAEGRHVSLACDGRVFARGTLAKVDERLAVLITECWGTRR